MKRFLLCLGILLFMPLSSPVLISQGSFGTVALGDVVHIPDLELYDSMGNLQNADSTVPCAVYEDDNDTAIVTFNLTLRTALTGEYRGTFTASAANGFEIGKYYNIICRPTLDGLTQAPHKGHFRIVAVEGYIYPRAVAVPNFIFQLQESDGDDCLGKAGVVVKTRSIDGAAFSAGTLGSVSEIGVGWYKLSVPAADMDGDELAFRFTATGCRNTQYKIRTQHN